MKTRRILRKKGTKNKQQYRKISNEKLQEMFAVYCNKRSIADVVRKCKVNRRTADRYCIIMQWDKQVDAIERRAIKKISDKAVNRLARNLSALDVAIDGIVQKIEKRPAKTPTVMLPHLVRVQEELLNKHPDVFSDDDSEDEKLEAAMRVLNKLSDREVTALGDLLVQHLEQEKEGGDLSPKKKRRRKRA